MYGNCLGPVSECKFSTALTSVLNTCATFIVEYIKVVIETKCACCHFLVHGIARTTTKKKFKCLFIILVIVYSVHNNYININTYLHKGQYGEVYKAEYVKGTKSNLTVAVKAIKKYQSQKAHDDFLEEMDILSQFVHPNIIKLYGLVQQGIVLLCSTMHLMGN